ncbi:hypothetical protein PR202_ga24052 [Eleusine coracana subsp. coracana]|uniref:Uncharacterized protein n=1 Tax=Eleusine coracana subsp. coracana TaxID=191504 RepID=A0AAV5D6U3_ELECO|nr:hypothetical protein PR202_ga24052 [Eleusine coracana subsp. coracana]
MEDLAASLMSHSHSAPLYLLYDASTLTNHGLAPPPVHDDDDGFEFARNGEADAALRACASDVSAAAFADELFRAGVLLPLRLPPRLQRSAGASAATSPTCRTTAAVKHRGFDPFAAALEKVRRDAAAPRRSRSLSPLRRSCAAAVSSAQSKKKDDSNDSRPRPTAVAAQKTASAAVAVWPARKGVKQLLYRAVVAGAAAAPRLLRPRKKGGVSYRHGLLPSTRSEKGKGEARRDRGVREKEEAGGGGGGARGPLIGRSALLALAAMASRRQTGPGAAAAAAAAARAPEQKRKSDAPKLIRRPLPVAPQPTARRTFGDASNLINGRAPLANHKKPVVVAADKCVKVVPQAAARSRRALNDVSNLINGRPTLANRHKAVPVATDRRGKAVKLKESNKPKPEVIVISSDSEKDKKALGGQRASRRTPIQTLTSILTKCSRASDGVISSPNKMQSYDIDAPDALNELAVVEYVNDIYSFYKRTEVKDLLCISDNAFSREQVLRTEKAILNQLQWNLTVPTMYMFIARYVKAAMGDKELENMTFFYAELALVQYSMLVYSPSLTAAAAVYAARCTLDIRPLWSDILKYHTGLAESELQGCARRLVSFHLAAPDSKQKAVYRKYSNPKLGAVSLYSPAKKLQTAAVALG